MYNQALEQHHLREDERSAFDATIVLDDDAETSDRAWAQHGLLDDGLLDDPTGGGVFHWAPLARGRASRRTAEITSALARHRPDLVVVDVSCEMVLQCRLSGVATAVMRQHGDRTDLAHTNAYRAASFLLAPFPPALEDPATPSWIISKTTYLGYPSPVPEPASTCVEPYVLVSWGRGGGAPMASQVDVLAEAAHPRRVVYAGPELCAKTASAAVEWLAWVDDLGSLTSQADIVVGAASNNTIAETAAAGAGLVVIPQDRPFQEQHRHAARLEALRAAAVLPAWPATPEPWRSALDQASTGRMALHDLSRWRSQSDAARVIDSLARVLADAGVEA